MTLAENTPRHRFGLGGAEVLNLELLLAAPLDEGGLGNAKLHHDVIEAHALRAHENKTGNVFLVGHNRAFRPVTHGEPELICRMIPSVPAPILRKKNNTRPGGAKTNSGRVVEG